MATKMCPLFAFLSSEEASRPPYFFLALALRVVCGPHANGGYRLSRRESALATQGQGIQPAAVTQESTEVS